MRIAICDDDVILCHQLEGILLGFGKNEDVPVQTSVFFDGKGLWKYMKQGNLFDLIFLDIEMEQMNGIAVGRAIRDIPYMNEIAYVNFYKELLFS